MDSTLCHCDLVTKFRRVGESRPVPVALRFIKFPFLVSALMALSGCTFDAMLSEQGKRIETLQTQLGTLEDKRLEVIQRQAVDKETALKDLHAAKMDQVTSMTNYVWAIDQTNTHNPVASNYRTLIDQYAQLSLAASPVKPTSEFQTLYAQKYQPLENAAVTAQQIQDVLTATEFKTINQQNQQAALKQADLDRITAQQRVELANIQSNIEAKRKELLGVTSKALGATIAELARANDVAKFYSQLIWIFGGCAALAVGAAVFLAYTGNVRMATYAGLAGAAFAGCAYLTLFLSENRWVLWVVFGIGVVCAAGVIFLRYGYGLRNTQLIGFAAKRDTLVRYITVELKKNLQDFGLAAGETLDTLDLHEVEKLQDDVVAFLKNQKTPVPDFLKS